MSDLDERLRLEAKRLELAPGDLVVLRTLDVLAPDQLIYLRQRAKEAFPKNPVIVLDAGLDIETVPRDRLRELLAK